MATQAKTETKKKIILTDITPVKFTNFKLEEWRVGKVHEQTIILRVNTRTAILLRKEHLSIDLEDFGINPKRLYNIINEGKADLKVLGKDVIEALIEDGAIPVERKKKDLKAKTAYKNEFDKLRVEIDPELDLQE